jgi:hypothetical protein
MTGRARFSIRSAFLLVFVTALAVRLLFLFVALPLAPRIVRGFQSAPGMPFDGYHLIALELEAGHGFALPDDGGPTAARAPLYPLFLASLYRLFGPRTGVVLIAHALLGALTCALVMLLGWRLFGRAVGLLAGLLMTFHPTHLWWSQYVLSETLLTLMLTLVALGLASFGKRRSAGSALLAGALLGLATLCNSVSLLFPPVLVVLALFGSAGARLARLRGALLVACAAAAIVMPWTLRNALRFHTLIPVNWGIGFQAFKGWVTADHFKRHPNDNLTAVDNEADSVAIATLREHGFVRGTVASERFHLSQTMTFRREEDAYLAQLAAERLREDPGGALRKMAMNLKYFWTLSIRRMEVVVALNLVLIAFAILGITATFGRDPARWLPLAYAGYLYLMYCSILVSARFTLQLMPVVSVCAAAGAVWLWTRLRRGPAESALAEGARNQGRA